MEKCKYALNIPIDIVNKILEYDGRIKYRNGEFINVIHPTILEFYRFILNPLLKKKVQIKNSIKYKRKRYYFNPHEDDVPIIVEDIEQKFYFEFDFDSLPGVGLSYDYGWNHDYFKVSYFDDRVYTNQHAPQEIVNII